MSDWTVYGRLDPTRWLNHRDPLDWVADPETTAALADPDLVVPLTPTGPMQRGIRTEAALYAAALYVIPTPATAGVVPPYPELPPLIDGAVYGPRGCP